MGTDTTLTLTLLDPLESPACTVAVDRGRALSGCHGAPGTTVLSMPS